MSSLITSFHKVDVKEFPSGKVTSSCFYTNVDIKNKTVTITIITITTTTTTIKDNYNNSNDDYKKR